MPHALPRPEPLPAAASRGRTGAAIGAASILALQAVALIAVGGWLMVRALGHDARHRGSTEVLGAMSVLVGVGVLCLAHAVFRHNGRVRSLLLILEIISLPIAVTIWQGGRWYVGLPLAFSAVLILVLLARSGLLSPSPDDADD